MSDYETLEYQEYDGVARITLNRPERHNCFDQQLVDELYSVWRALRINDDVRVVVLTGAGESAFCTGVDRFETFPQPSSPFMVDDPGTKLGPKSADLWKPVIAAVNGMACGGAFYLLGEADFIVAADHATFFDPHVSFGMAASFEPMLMSHRMPFGEIMRLSLMGNYERMSAERAHQVGLVTQVTKGSDLMDETDRIARLIATHPTVAVQGTVRSLWATRYLALGQALSMAPHLVTLGNQPAALGEGQAAFTSGQRVPWQLR